MPEKNKLYRISVTELNNLGFGVGRVEGQVVFISGAVDGDLVEARMIRVNRSYAIARVERVLEPSPHRAPSPCAARGCGGCAYRHITAAHEAALKENYVREVFRKHGLPHVTVLPLLTTGVRYHYRNKAQYPVAPERDGGVRIGFFAPKSHRVVAAETCPLQDEVFPPIVQRLHTLFDRYHIPAYEEEGETGLVRHIYLRCGKASGEVLLTLVLRQDKLPHEAEIVADLRAAFPQLVGILVNVNPNRTNVICGDTWRTLWGKDSMQDTLCGVRLALSPAAFYQVNHDAAELLYRRARELAAPQAGELLLDLFCGAGSIGLSMADAVREVIGIEIVESAVTCARQNAAQNGIQNASFYCGDAEESENLLQKAEAARGEKIKPDIVILDPPRKGCGERLLAYVARLNPSRVVYISCNPDTLARDVAVFARLGYVPGPVTPVDLFPCTGHVETVCLLSKLQNR